MRRAAASPFGEFGAFGTRFKVDKARQREWLQNPALEERDVWPRVAIPLADIAEPADQADYRASCPAVGSPRLGGTERALPSYLGDPAAQRGAHVRACLAVNALEGRRGAQAYATVSDGYLVLRRTNGDVLAQLRLCGLELVDIGERRIVIVSVLAPTELTLEDLCILEMEEEQDFHAFWDMMPARRATCRDIQGDKLQSALARPIAEKLPTCSDSRPSWLPTIPEVPRAEAPVTDSSAATPWHPSVGPNLTPSKARALRQHQALSGVFRPGRDC